MPLREQNFKGALRKSGFKATGPRIAILEYFKKNVRPLSAQHVIDHFDGAINQATIYRTLKSLKQTAMIKQIDLRHNHAHYELADTNEHHHLICTHCGKIEDVRHCNLEAIEGIVIKQSKHFSIINQHALEFYGMCKACAKHKI